MPTTSGPLAILVIEDNPADYCLIEDMLHSSRIKINNIYSATRIAEACDLIQQHRIDLVLLDLSLPDGFGIDSFLKIKPFVHNIPVIILTGQSDSGLALEALQEGAQDYLVKGEFKANLLAKSIQYSIERKMAEKKISISEEKYRQMFYKNPFPAWIYDLDNLQILEVNDAAIEKFGYERMEFLDLTLEDLRPSADIPAMRISVTNQGILQHPQEKIWQHKKKNGDIMLMEVSFYEINYYGKTAMQAQMNDVTEKKRLEKTLKEQQQLRQQQIAEAILGAQEEERKSLGAELHDNINQILATAKLYLNASQGDQVSLIQMISKSEHCIGLAIEEIRKLSKILITPVFISTGLKQAIEVMASDICAMKKIKIVTELDTLENAGLSEVLKITIYRVIQEQLNNILKYAEASRVNIRVNVKEDSIILTISDNGKGFDTQLPRKGIGMINIQNRAELFNGKVEIDSAPGKGCRLKVELNIKLITPQKTV